jgi:hypothetical protein
VVEHRLEERTLVVAASEDIEIARQARAVLGWT